MEIPILVYQAEQDGADPEYDDDDDEEPDMPAHEVSIEEQRRAYMARLPQAPSSAIYISGSQVNVVRNVQYGIFWRSDDCQYQRPRNAYGWANAADGNTVAILHPNNPAEISIAITALNELALAHPDFSYDVWCNDSPESRLPGKWVGQYVATVTNDPQGDRNRVVSEHRYTCWHCAFKAGLAAVDNARPYSLPYNFSQFAEIFPEWMPNSIEIVGENPPLTTATIKDVTAEIAVSCGNCGRVGHRSNACAFQPKVYDKVGIEIEGRFLNFAAVNERRENAGLTGNSDGSINRTPDATQTVAYEFQTVPGSLRKACQQLVDYYPDEADQSCGMHVHVSFDAVDITMLNTPAFFRYFKQRWMDWGTRMGLAPTSQFFRRLEGRNTYCRPMNYDAEINIARQDRYHQLNFNAFGDHGTVECRLLPMFRRSSLGVAAVQELLDIYETYLHNPVARGFTEHNAQCLTAQLADLMTPYVNNTVQELEVPEPFVRSTTRELELSEVQPVGEGMVRIAMPINNPITLDALAQAVRLRRAA